MVIAAELVLRREDRLLRGRENAELEDCSRFTTRTRKPGSTCLHDVKDTRKWKRQDETPRSHLAQRRLEREWDAPESQEEAAPKMGKTSTLREFRCVVILFIKLVSVR